MSTPCRNRAHSPRLAAGKWSCPDCTPATPTPAQLAAEESAARDRGLAAARAAKAQGMTAATSAHPDERARVEAAVRKLAAQGKPFSANDARAIHGVKGGVVGAVFNALRAEGLIAPCGDEPSDSGSTHGHRIFRWQGIRAAAA